MSDDKAQELGPGDFAGGEQVRDEEDLGADKAFSAENEEREGEEFVVENEISEKEESFREANDTETISVSSCNKRMKKTSIDRLSALPDSLLIRILSLLDTKEAATTGVLSRRWQFLWTDLPRLKFCESSSENEKISKFVAWVNRTLVVCNGMHLTSFGVDFTYDRCFASDVNVWVRFAVFNMVRDVSLLLNSSSREDFYTLPQMMFGNSFVRRLSMRRCMLAPQGTIEWRSLASLLIEEVELPQHVIENILSGCPLLCNLVLKAYWGFNRLEISQKLSALGIIDREDEKSEPLLEISAPHIHSFAFRHYPKGRQLRLSNVPSLIKAYIHFNAFDWDASSAEAMSNMKDILQNLQHVRELELGSRSIEVLSMLLVNGWQLPQSRREYLKLEATSDEHCISGIVALLESSPNLETLVIDGYEPIGASVTTCPAASCDLDCDLLHLKNVVITIFDLAGEPMLKIVQILLKRATVLEKMVIDVEEFMKFVSTSSTSNDYIKLSQAVKMGKTIISLLKYPKSSQNAVVLLR